MADQTPRLKLEYLLTNQAQKEVTINTNTNILEMLVQSSAKGILSTPPSAPQDGDIYIVGSAATGVWSGHENYLAGFLGGVWNLIAPGDGWRVWVQNEKKARRYQNGGWIEEQRADAPMGIPTGGTVGQVLVKKSNADYDVEWQTIKTPDIPIVPDAPAGESIFDKIAIHQLNTTYKVGDIVYRKETKLNKWYYCDSLIGGVSVGTSGTTAPAWKESAGDETTDNNIIWVTYDGGSALVAVYADSASTATKLKTARSITLTGGATGTAKFNGSANIEIPVTLNTINL